MIQKKINGDNAEDDSPKCCYCSGKTLEYRKKMIRRERDLQTGGVTKLILKFKEQDIWWCSKCRRYCLSFKKDTIIEGREPQIIPRSQYWKKPRVDEWGEQIEDDGRDPDDD